MTVSGIRENFRQVGLDLNAAEASARAQSRGKASARDEWNSADVSPYELLNTGQ
mgnify:CR=1 FL=1